MSAFSLEGMYNWAVNWCTKPNVGYDQGYRNMELKDGYITCFDCSSFLFFAIWLGGGYDVGQLGYPTDLSKYQAGEVGYNAWGVSGMRNCLPYIGFTKLEPKPIVWKPGDILVKNYYTPGVDDKHCEICYKPDRYTMGAHNSRNSLPQQVSINDWQTSTSYYDEVWRFTNGEPPITPPGPYDPSDPGNGGDYGDKKPTPLWRMLSPWWKRI